MATRRTRRALLAAALSTVVALTGCSSVTTPDDGDAADAGNGDAGATVTDQDASGTSDDREQAAGDERPITVEGEGIELAGTLRVPAGDGPHPGAVIVPGSGPHDRAGAVPGQLGLTLPSPVAVYEQLAVGLQAHGYAALTWDKRTCGPFNGCADNGYPAPPPDLTIDTLVADVVAAVDRLAAHDDIGEVVLLGHSQGGTIALDVVADRSDIAAAVLLATPYAPVDELLAEQAETLADLVAAAGQTGATAEAQVAEMRAVADDVAALRMGDPDPAGEPIAGASPAFWASWLTLSDAAPSHVEERSAPALFLGGEHDWNVPPEDVERWAEHLRADDDLQVLDGITHALTRLDEADPAAITPADLGTRVDPAVVDTIAAWLDALLAG